jgi:hypothetical protein
MEYWNYGIMELWKTGRQATAWRNIDRKIDNRGFGGAAHRNIFLITIPEFSNILPIFRIKLTP